MSGAAESLRRRRAADGRWPSPRGSLEDLGEQSHEKGEKPSSRNGRTNGTGKKRRCFGDLSKDLNAAPRRKVVCSPRVFWSLLIGYQPISRISVFRLRSPTLLHQSRRRTCRKDEFCIYSIKTVEHLLHAESEATGATRK